jgi:hypothetical protein
MRTEALIRPETESAASRAIPAGEGASRRQVLNLGQLNRSVALVVLGVAAVVMMAFMPVDDRVGVSAPPDAASLAPLTGRSILHFPR